MMAIRLSTALSIYLLYSIRSFDCLVQADHITQDAAHKSVPTWPADSSALLRAKRETRQWHVSLVEPPGAADEDALSQPSQPDGDFFLGGHEHDDQTVEKDGKKGGKEPTPTPASGAEVGAEQAEDDSKEIVSPLVVYLIIAGIILMMIALLVIGVAIIYIINSIPASDKEDDGCGKGNARPFPREPPPQADDRRYSEQSVDLVHKSHGSSLSRQSSCRICPRFAPKSSGGRASCASTGTSSSGGSDDLTSVAAPAAGKKDYFVSCVCDLATQEYSPSASTTTTFGRC